MQKKMLGVVPGPKGHWVGDGFPAEFEPAATLRGVART
jgi:hypothetical protein